jgi:hypothetical protein
MILDGLESVLASAAVPEFDAAVAEACRNIYKRCAIYSEGTAPDKRFNCTSTPTTPPPQKTIV